MLSHVEPQQKEKNKSNFEYAIKFNALFTKYKVCIEICVIL